MATITISIVTFAPNFDVLARTLSSLVRSAQVAVSGGSISAVELFVVDNGPGASWKRQIEALCAEQWPAVGLGEWEVISSGENLGYGRGHNLAIEKGNSDYHLVLNPDVEMAEDSLKNAIGFLAKHKDVGCVTPYATGSEGRREYLCKQFPSVLTLFLRGFAPTNIRRLFSRRLATYEMRGVTEDRPVNGVPIASGCFMLFRADVLKCIGGFSSKYFLYFEDFDLSLRFSQASTISYVPSVRVVHAGGYASKKGVRHIKMFAESAVIFFSEHGWRWV